MSLDLWLVYVATVFVISGTPGPNMLLTMTHGIHYGMRRTLSTMLGLLAGLAVVLSVSLGGLGALLVASAHAFDVIKYVGAAYLVYLGIKTWRAADAPLAAEGGVTLAGAWVRFRTGLFVSLSNPKAILFAMAFFPQFIDRDRPMAVQLSVLLATFVVIETAWMVVYAAGGARLAAWLRGQGRVRWFNRAAGLVFIGAGVVLGTFRR